MSEVLVWARRWAKRPEAAEHELLEVSAVATMDTVRSAYHRLARFAHPDLHRTAVTTAELEEITETFARVSNAYSVLSARLRQNAAKVERRETRPPSGASSGTSSATSSGRAGSADAAGAAASAAQRPGRAPPSAVTEKRPSFTAPASRLTSAPPVGPSGILPGAARPSAMPPSSSTGPATGLSSKAMLHYRRAELCLRRGELVEARLHLKLALASDPNSAFLRRALEELDRG